MLNDGGAAGVIESEVARAAQKAVVAYAQNATELTHAVSRGLVLGGVGRRSRPHCLHLPPRACASRRQLGQSIVPRACRVDASWEGYVWSNGLQRCALCGQVAGDWSP